MNIEMILSEYDAMFGEASLQEIEAYLVQKIAQAGERSETSVLFTLLNEAIGFFRDTTQRQKALECCDELLALMETMELKGSYEYATALLNIANAYRAFGKFEDSLQLFRDTLDIYQKKVPVGDFAYANLYNNWSLLYQETEAFVQAAEMLEKALEIVNSYEGALMQQATTRTNLATTLLQIGTEDAYLSARRHLSAALDIFEADGGRDFHYAAALVAMGDAYSAKQDYVQATGYYAKGLKELENHVGKTANYIRVLEKYQYAMTCSKSENVTIHSKEFVQQSEITDSIIEEVWKSNMDRSREFYEQYGIPMIHNLFPECEERIAVGLVGEGSDCYGFDDEISMDHDYEVGFCMWLTDEDYEKIGERLQRAYAELVDSMVGNGQSTPNRFLGERRGVFTINDFYNRLLGYDCNLADKCMAQHVGGKSFVEYHYVQEFQLAAATNGNVFRDDLGVFSAIRNKILEYYPDQVWREKIAQGLHEFAQYAQSNYARMMARGDRITAQLCVAKGVESAMDLLYLLQRRYAPYYKWKRKGLGSNEVLLLLDHIVVLPPQTAAWEKTEYRAAILNVQDECVVLFEKVARALLEEMKRHSMVTGEDVFLENYVGQLLYGKAERESMCVEAEDENQKTKLVKHIVELEWEQFDKVKNEGGRADCQDNFPTFSIMRKSQYLAWPEELLVSYCNDLQEAASKGWNLIMEKYARMMERTAPVKYAEMEKNLPQRSAERIAIAEEIIKIQVAWMEEFAVKYPKMADNARSIRSEEDTEYNTSYETYLRGEMGTYSENTFVLYGRFIVGMMQAGRNLAYEIMENTAHLYGYESVEDAEYQLG